MTKDDLYAKIEVLQKMLEEAVLCPWWPDPSKTPDENIADLCKLAEERQ